MPGDTDLFQLKVFYGGLQSREALVAHYRRHLEEREAALEGSSPSPTTAGAWLLPCLSPRLGIESARLDIRWAEDVLKELEQ